MARLFSLMSAGAVDDPEYGHFDADGDGAFDFPDELSDRLHGVHHRRRRAWETQEERDTRLHGDEQARRRDPESLYSAVAELVNLAKMSATATSGADDGEAKAAAPRSRSRAT